MSTASLTIRAATGDDVAAIARLLTQLKEWEGSADAVDAAKLAAALQPDAHVVKLRALVAERQGEVIGTMLYYSGYDVLTAAYGYHLADFIIDAAHRRQGVGRQLFTALAAQNLAEGGEWISLTVLPQNDAGKGFYDALGMMHVPVDFYAAGKVMLQTATLLQN